MTPPSRVLVTGARGMLGTDLCPILAESGWQVIAADIAEFDITDRAQTRAFVADAAPAALINCAAYTAVDQAQTERELAFRVNRDGAQNLAIAASEAGAFFVHLSTDYVFDGRKPGPYLEDDPPNPSSVYGESKLAGEQAVRAALAEHCIVRTAWLYGLHGKSFPRTILTVAQQGKPLRVVNDQRGCPTYTVHLARALAAIIEQPHYGTYHAVNSGNCTWYDLACAALREAGIAADIAPCATSEFPRPAPRPANSVLDTSRLQRTFGLQLPPWQQGIAEFVRLWQQERRA
ncbi:MAG: dTDP-4-dehydrorhamnose reductase [Armatimonadota bacterium]